MVAGIGGVDEDTQAWGQRRRGREAFISCNIGANAGPFGVVAPVWSLSLALR